MTIAKAEPGERFCKHCGVAVELTALFPGPPQWWHTARRPEPPRAPLRYLECRLTFYAEPESEDAPEVTTHIPLPRSVTQPPVQRDDESDQEYWTRITAPTKQREGDQRLPEGGQECVQDRVIAEMEESKRVGLERYGSTLMTFNGRSTIQDAAEEVRDLHVYLMQVRMEAEASRETLIEVVKAAVRKERQDFADANRESQFDDADIALVAVDSIMGWVIGQQGAQS